MFHYIQLSASTRPLYLYLGLLVFFFPSQGSDAVVECIQNFLHNKTNEKQKNSQKCVRESQGEYEFCGEKLYLNELKQMTIYLQCVEKMIKICPRCYKEHENPKYATWNYCIEQKRDYYNRNKEKENKRCQKYREQNKEKWETKGTKMEKGEIFFDL